MLKNTGLGYTVIRAGPLLEEPGGYKALIFDQVPAIMASSSAQHAVTMTQHGCTQHVAIHYCLCVLMQSSLSIPLYT